MNKSESGIVWLIRTTCKAMGRHGSEQSVVYQPFTTLLKARNPLTPFRGNRFNILFYDTGVVYFLSSLIRKFLNCWCMADSKQTSLSNTCWHKSARVYCWLQGSWFNKTITGPLWRVIESKDLSILDISHRYQVLVECIERWSQDAASVVSHEAVLFSDFPPPPLLMTTSLMIWLLLVSSTPQYKRFSKLLFVLFQTYFLGS